MQCSNLANTREHLRVVIERRVDRACIRVGVELAANGDWRTLRRRGVTAAFAAPKRQRLDAASDEKATADCPRNMTPHGQVRLQQDAEIAHRGRGPYLGPISVLYCAIVHYDV